MIDKTRLLSHIALVTALLFGVLSLFACGEANPSPKSPQFLGTIKQNTEISVSLSALMTFNVNGQNITSLKEFSVEHVPITWEDTTFSGNVSGESVTGNGTVYSVHGIVTSDGTWIEHVSFSQDFTEGAAEPSYWEITLYALPIVNTGEGNLTTVGIFDQTGDIRKHVLLIDYWVGRDQYVSSDWQSSVQPPVIKLKFGTEGSKAQPNGN